MPPAAENPLWERLRRFDLDDPGASLTFTRRLARENGWSVGFAARVVEEYKRFVYLAMTAGHEVTPSDEVDQAWHLHLTYTRSYWQELCGEVLGRPLHHGPTKGGPAEAERFEEQYERTLASYRAAFGGEPPEDVWPPASIRFGEAADFVRVNKSRAWVLRKPWRVDRGRPVALAACLALVAPPLAANEFGVFFLFVAILFAVVALLSILKGGNRRGGRRRSGRGSGGGWGGWFGDGSGCGGGGCASGCGGGGGGGGCGGGGCGGS